MSVDVLIIAALREELEPLLEVREGVEGGWREDGDLFRAALAGTHGRIEVAVAWLAKTGGVQTATDASLLVKQLDAKCLAMCGVCGGHPSDTEYGDVVIAERVTQHDEGKHGAEGFKRDLWVHAMPEDWRKEAHARANKPATGLFGYREPDVEASKWWMLERIAARENVRTCKAAKRYLPGPRYLDLVNELEKRLEYIKGKGEIFEITKNGRDALGEHRRVRPLWFESLPYHTQVGVIVSGNAVEADGTIWKTMAEGGVRKVVAVEMEAFAIGHVASTNKIPFVVCKGVMDHADPSKSDNYKPFAARASAEVLCSFLRKMCKPSQAISTRPRPHEGPEVGVAQAALLAELDRYNAEFPATSKLRARQLRSELEQDLPKCFETWTSFGDERDGVEETPARNPVTAEIREALRGGRKMELHVPAGKGDPEPRRYLSMDDHPEAGMDLVDEAESIAADVLRIDPQHAKRLAHIAAHAQDRGMLPAHAEKFSQAERLQNVIDRLAEDEGFYTMIFAKADDRVEILRKYLPGLKILLSVEHPDWLAVESKIAAKLCKFYRNYYAINPEDASR